MYVRVAIYIQSNFICIHSTTCICIGSIIYVVLHVFASYLNIYEYMYIYWYEDPYIVRTVMKSVLWL